MSVLLVVSHLQILHDLTGLPFCLRGSTMSSQVHSISVRKAEKDLALSALFLLISPRKMWATFNEALTFTHLASGYGKAPSMQPYMDVDVWPKVAGHNVPVACKKPHRSHMLQIGAKAE